MEIDEPSSTITIQKSKDNSYYDYESYVDKYLQNYEIFIGGEYIGRGYMDNGVFKVHYIHEKKLSKNGKRVKQIFDDYNIPYELEKWGSFDRDIVVDKNNIDNN